MTGIRGSRSTSVPTNGANTNTGMISAKTTVLTPSGEPVRSRTSRLSATVAKTSPHCDPVRAAHSLR